MLKSFLLVNSAYDEDEGGSSTAFFLEEKIDAAEFIIQVNPKRVDLNNIPIKKWFVYHYNDNYGDSYYESLYLLDKYIDERIQAIMTISHSVLVAKQNSGQ